MLEQPEAFQIDQNCRVQVDLLFYPCAGNLAVEDSVVAVTMDLSTEEARKLTHLLYAIRLLQVRVIVTDGNGNQGYGTLTRS